MLPSAAKTIHQLFEEQAERSPDAVAYYFEPGPLSYRELNERSNRLASYLRRAGIRPNVPVGICLERSAEMVVSLLAVLKAGGAYVPLEPTAPTQRLREILQDTEPPLLLLHSHLDPFAEYDGRTPARDLRPKIFQFLMLAFAETFGFLGGKLSA